MPLQGQLLNEKPDLIPPLFRNQSIYVAVDCSAVKGAHGRHSKKRVLVVGQTGLIICKVKKKSAKIKEMISILDITQIDLPVENTLVFFACGSRWTFVTPNSQIVLSEFLRIHSYLSYCNEEFAKSLRLPANVSYPSCTTRPVHLTTFRYRVISGKLGIQMTPGLMGLFADFDRSIRTQIAFHQRFDLPESIEQLLYPIVFEPDLALVQFIGYAPAIAGILVHELIKRSKSVTTIVIRDYDEFSFEHLRFGDIGPANLVSLHLRNVFSTNPRGHELFLESLGEYQGDWQQLTISNFKFTGKNAETFAVSMTTQKCYRTLEYLAIENCVCEASETDAVKRALTSISENLEGLYRFSLTWSAPIEISSETFSINTCRSLRSCVLGGLDFTGVSENIELPSSVVDIEFPNCAFKASQLLSILKSRTKTSPLTVVVPDLKMNDSEWGVFFHNLSLSDPFSNIAELDWSGNEFKDGNEKVFCEKLISSQSIRFLALSRCCRHGKIEPLLNIIKSLENSNLWGIQIRGSEDEEFQLKEDIIEIVKSLKSIVSLEHVDICDHMLEPLTVKELLDIFKNMNVLHEVAMDGTKMIGDTLIGCYHHLKRDVPVQAILPPLKDMRQSCALRQLLESKYYQKFMKILRETRTTTPREVRIRLYERTLDCNKKLWKLLSGFPVSCLLEFPLEMFGLPWIDFSWTKVRTFSDEKPLPITGSLNDHLNAQLLSPYVTPKCPRPRERVRLPERIRECELVDFETEDGVVCNYVNYLTEKVLKMSEVLFTPEFSDIWRQFDILSAVFAKFDDVEDPYPQVSASIPLPEEYISKRGISIVRNKCEQEKSVEVVSEEQQEAYEEEIGWVRSETSSEPESETSSEQKTSSQETTNETSSEQVITKDTSSEQVITKGTSSEQVITNETSSEQVITKQTSESHEEAFNKESETVKNENQQEVISQRIRLLSLSSASAPFRRSSITSSKPLIVTDKVTGYNLDDMSSLSESYDTATKNTLARLAALGESLFAMPPPEEEESAIFLGLPQSPAVNDASHPPITDPTYLDLCAKLIRCQ